ncbi:MAG: Sensor protein [Microgenomates group bacterium LiPW_31]|nr:MAG: Sensor protein [Microgenomates group bacterium LiPW_31]
MDLKNIIILISAGINLSLGILIFLKGRQKIVNKAYTLLAFAVFFWSIGMVLYRLALTLEESIFWCKILYAAPIFIVGSFLYFTYIFPEEKAWPAKKLLIAIIPACLLMLYLVLFTETIVKDVIFNLGKEKTIIFGWLYYSYVFFISGLFIWAYVNLLEKRRTIVGIARAQITYVFWGTFLASILGMTTNLSLPTFGIFYFNWLGQILSVIMSVFIAYAILKHHLMNIRVIATEIFSILASLVFLVNMSAAKSLGQFILNLSLFIAISFFSIMLIRSVIKEIKSKEQLVQLTTQLQKAYEDLKVLDVAKSEFVSMASHQLRTPLSAIKGYISMLIEGSYGQIPDKAREKLKNVFQSNERLVRVVNDLLDISRIEMGKMEVEKTPTQIEDLVRSCYEEMKIGAEKKGVKFVFKKTKTPLPKIEIDSLKIRQVFLNLIDNAIRYTREGEIEIEVKKADSSIRVSVRDTGEGLTPAEQRDIFEGFARGSAGLTYFIEGAGLGLYVAKKFLELHQGKIWVESEGKDKGSTFFVELPIK